MTGHDDIKALRGDSGGPVLDIRDAVDEALYVLAGRLDMQLGDVRLPLEPRRQG